MDGQLDTWERHNFQPGGGDASLFYVVFGPPPADWTISKSRYRCDGVPSGLDILRYGPNTHPEVLNSFRKGYLWEELVNSNKVLTDVISTQSECLIFKGTIPDPTDLNYLRDTIGLIEWLLDCDCVAVFDAFAFNWRDSTDWHASAFEQNTASPRNHVSILQSEDCNGEWLHTRGMIKFGRPDISIRRVSKKMHDPVVYLLNRFIEFQAFGGIIEEGQDIRVASLPAGMICHHQGDFEDPDFNNVHIEIRWPE